MCGDQFIPWDDLSAIIEVVSQGDASSGFTEYPGDEFQRLRVVNMLRGYLGLGRRQGQVIYRLPENHPFGSIEWGVGHAPNSREWYRDSYLHSYDTGSY